ncbi:hypothetical protein ACSQ6I_01710 [Anabaena sp. WFMT]|uniref:hypothetical protein n=1 Tax=Anabaena sp. WFMT TaxID=3449730 RepID=UPI003F27666D
MTGFTNGYETVRKDAWFALQDANHLAVAYRLRATQLTKWKRVREFINLGVAPGLLSATFVWDNAVLRTILVVFSGLCSVSSWVWVIFGFSFNWDNQLSLSIEIPQKLSLLIPDIEENLESLTNLQNTNNGQEAEKAANKLKNLMQQVKSLKGELEREQVHIDPWMNLIAQQDTMRNRNGKCGSCYQEWIPGSKILNTDSAKALIKKVKTNKLQGICEDCGQQLSRTP